MIGNFIDIGDFRITLSAARHNAKLTQDEVCKVLHVSKPTLVKWERYYTLIPTDKLNILCELYRIPDRDLIFLPNKLS